ncbi:cobalamin-independent methionine synthase II family protein [Roseiarcaceae bacterium H3SJ34-1]|uniref:cobalamin-independent methionine synthase II family protein n=1 Tax=Terripilifer ovatus TaxID=3032367 RepID=UPI003AB97DEA|nr:cobalamin-independent methionine synthase II family protein [Roseiarcaceae bacterium H3SJ34-1]
MTFIETTHVGSLPRSAALAAALLKRDHGEAVDEAAFDALVTGEIEAAVRQQAEAGVSIVSDGELGKVGYSTYITQRLSGFGGHVDRMPSKDLADLPDLRQKLAAIMGTQTFTRAACIGPVALVDFKPVEDDIRRFKTAMNRQGGDVRGFLNTASPGLITAFQPNKFYPTHEAYLADLVTAMRPEYEAIAAAGFDLQLDAPDLAMAAHTGFQNLSEAEFLARAEQNVEALNAATANIPPERMRLHICWGNYEGPHDFDIPLEKVISIVLKARPAQLLFEAANPRHEHEWIVWRDARLPADKVLVPGLIDTCSNYIEHPELIAQRIERFAGIVGPERVIAGTDCGFGTFAGYGKIDTAVAWKKLRALREGADIAAARL